MKVFRIVSVALCLLIAPTIAAASTTQVGPEAPSRMMFICGQQCDLDFTGIVGQISEIAVDTPDSGWAIDARRFAPPDPSRSAPYKLETLPILKPGTVLGPVHFCAAGRQSESGIVQGTVYEVIDGQEKGNGKHKVKSEAKVLPHPFEIIFNPSDSSDAFAPNSPCLGLHAL